MPPPNRRAAGVSADIWRSIPFGQVLPPQNEDLQIFFGSRY